MGGINAVGGNVDKVDLVSSIVPAKDELGLKIEEIHQKTIDKIRGPWRPIVSSSASRPTTRPSSPVVSPSRCTTRS